MLQDLDSRLADDVIYRTVREALPRRGMPFHVTVFRIFICGAWVLFDVFVWSWSQPLRMHSRDVDDRPARPLGAVSA